ncbi:MAG: hypothetical protein BWY75_01491 [bacterium ADurb.Bin425]|nr:MAG: hypothetical protein BWY75_01491 [bacterium ADurb.Bin425]
MASKLAGIFILGQALAKSIGVPEICKAIVS